MAAYYNEHEPQAVQWLRKLIERGHIAPGVVDDRSILEVKPGDLAGFNQCHFFAGIGVWSYALRSAGFPDDGFVWTGSCPCQPFSAAGKGKEFGDARHLWPAFYKLIRECRPVVVFGEQVASADALAWLDHVCADLESAGYAVGTVDSCAAGYGAPHLRQRLYFVAMADANGASGSRQFGLLAEGRAGNGRATNGQRTLGTVADAGHERRWREDAPRSAEFGASIHDSGCGEVEPLAHAANVGHGRKRDNPRWRGESFSDSGMGDAAGGRCGIGGDAPFPGDSGHVDGASGELGDAERARLPTGRERSNPDVAEAIGRGTRPNGTASESGSRSSEPGAVNGFWRDAEWIACRDGKARPTGPGIHPLVGRLAIKSGAESLANGFAAGMVHGGDTGAPFNPNATGEARTMRLRGYGNAINAQQATEFIRAYLSLDTEQ